MVPRVLAPADKLKVFYPVVELVLVLVVDVVAVRYRAIVQNPHLAVSRDRLAIKRRGFVSDSHSQRVHTSQRVRSSVFRSAGVMGFLF